ncbi:MAG: hypothetical protein LIO41_00125 [Ruminococcus sp.]|nr:hypothetical protein [Ruminococcus sp.]
MGTVMYNTKAVEEVKTDFLKTLGICKPITESDCKRNIFVRLFQEILRLFAPLM